MGYPQDQHMPDKQGRVYAQGPAQNQGSTKAVLQQNPELLKTLIPPSQGIYIHGTCFLGGKADWQEEKATLL